MKNNVLHLFICFFTLIAPPISVSAQDCCCCKFRQSGQRLYDAGNYAGAIKKWQTAQNCSDQAQCSDLGALIEKARQKQRAKDQAATAAKQKREQEAREAAQRQQAQRDELERQRRQADNDLYDMAKSTDTQKAYETYLAKTKYPNGEHAQAARRRIAELTAATSGGPPGPVSSEPAKAKKLLIPAHMVLVTGGSYDMGDVMNDNEGADEKPVHRVTVGDFLMGKGEVTFEEYDAFCEATGRTKPSDGGWGRARRPVINVSWYDAIEYCNWRSGREGLKPVYTIDKSRQDPDNSNTSDKQKWIVRPDFSANGYRLPTEAEWEYAAREGGRKVRFGDGRDVIDPARINFDARANYKKTYSVVGEYRKKTVPVDELAANSLGLKHMSGNVWEWCWDWYGSDYYAASPGANPVGPTSGQYRVYRGGSWSIDPVNCRAGNRSGNGPYIRGYYLGFRLVRDY